MQMARVGNLPEKYHGHGSDMFIAIAHGAAPSQ
jgi:hypothetical protein